MRGLGKRKALSHSEADFGHVSTRGCFRGMQVIILLLPLAAAAYSPPGVLQQLVDEKRREVERLKKLPENREDGSWYLRLSYPATTASYTLGRAIGWKREELVVLADLKRASPTGQIGRTVEVNPGLVIQDSLADVKALGCNGALVCTDLASHGGSYRDLKAATMFAKADAAPIGNPTADQTFPIVAKDLIIDPLQIARASCEGASAVVLVAAACLPDLPLLLDTCTVMGVEALVEVHTPDEVTIAAECAAGMLLVNERDRATGELVVGQAAAIAPLLPPDAQCLACGGIARIDQVRTLRRAGYDGIVLGRALAAEPKAVQALMGAIRAEPTTQRATEAIRVPVRSRPQDDQAVSEAEDPIPEPDEFGI